MKRLQFIILFIFCMGLVACASESTDPASMFKGQNASQLFQNGHHLMLKGDYDEAVQHFETLDARYPFSRYAKQAQLDSIYAYYQNDDEASALVAADRYMRLYPRGPNVDYAYYMHGLIQLEQNRGAIEKRLGIDYATRDLTMVKKAYFDFERLVKYFPRSKYASDAKQRMIDIRNLLSRHELQVAQYYFDQKAYVAAANRANMVVQHYQQTPSVPKALAIMVNSYHALHLTKQADNAYRVLKLNFPKSPALKTVEKFSAKDHL